MQTWTNDIARCCAARRWWRDVLTVALWGPVLLWCLALLMVRQALTLAHQAPPVMGPLRGCMPGRRWFRKTLPLPALMVVLLSPWLLCGCGTAPSAVRTLPPVPAELMAPPQPPTLLRVPQIQGSRWLTPGTTTEPTRLHAPPID